MLHGRILAESLRIGCDLRIPGLRIVRIDRRDVSAGAADYQPGVWTLLDVEGPAEVADEFAAALADALVEGQGWYADFHLGDQHVIAFPGRVFRYAVGDRAGRAAAVAYGLSAGVPAPQLDWGD